VNNEIMIGKQYSTEKTKEKKQVSELTTHPGWVRVEEFILNRIAKVDRLHDVSIENFEKESLIRKAKYDAYKEIINYVKQSVKEYNIIKTKEIKNG